MKTELLQFWADYKEEFISNVLVFILAIVSLGTIALAVTAPMLLWIFTGVWGFLLLYLIVLPGIFTALAVMGGGEYDER